MACPGAVSASPLLPQATGWGAAFDWWLFHWEGSRDTSSHCPALLRTHGPRGCPSWCRSTSRKLHHPVNFQKGQGASETAVLPQNPEPTPRMDGSLSAGPLGCIHTPTCLAGVHRLLTPALCEVGAAMHTPPQGPWAMPGRGPWSCPGSVCPSRSPGPAGDWLALGTQHSAQHTWHWASRFSQGDRDLPGQAPWP